MLVGPPGREVDVAQRRGLDRPVEEQGAVLRDGDERLAVVLEPKGQRASRGVAPAGRNLCSLCCEQRVMVTDGARRSLDDSPPPNPVPPKKILGLSN